jgi:hypothetical protein
MMSVRDEVFVVDTGTPFAMAAAGEASERDDVALFLVMRDEDTVDRGGERLLARATATHPARLATWTLYGDPGYQTGRELLLRLLQRMRSPARPSPSEPQ